MIRAVTLDLWDTLILDDSDEPKRAARGLPSKPVERRILVHSLLEKHAPISREMVDLAYDTTDAAFRQVWYGQNVTWTVRERLAVLLRGLGRELPSDEIAELVRLHEEMELEIMPDPVPGAVEAVRCLRSRYKLAVVSDAIFSPGRVLRELLKTYAIYGCFDHFSFSDELGCSKPDPRMFEAAARGLNVDLREMVHVGDRVEKDVDGPRAVGAKSILLRASGAHGGEHAKADAVCDDLKDLPAIVDRLNLPPR